MNPLLSIIVFALLGIALIVLAMFHAKRLRMSGYAASYWILLFVFLFGQILTITGCDNIWGSGSKTVLVYEVILPDELQDDANADPEKTAQDYVSSKMDQIASVIKRRIDPNGFISVSVRQCDSNKIEIVIPQDDPEEIARLKKIIPLSGTLEFRILASKNYPEDNMLIDLGLKSNDRIIKRQTGINQEGKATYSVFGMWIPVMEGRENEFHNSNFVTRTRSVNDAEILEVLCIKDIYDVTGQFLTGASVGTDNVGGYCVNFRFNKEGANRLGKLTSYNSPNVVHDRYRNLGIILNGELYSAPRINSRVNGDAEITGNFTEAEARSLAETLNSGTLPVKLSKEPVSETVIDPANGAKSTVQDKESKPDENASVE